MKKLLLGCILTLGSAASMAEEIKLIPGDDSPYTRACLAAVESRASLEEVRREEGLTSRDLAEIRCNGKHLHVFTHLYSRQPASVETRLVSADEPLLRFNMESDDIETRLCHAAVTSREEFQRLREEHFANVDVDRQIACNGMPISRFAKKYSTGRYISSTR